MFEYGFLVLAFVSTLALILTFTIAVAGFEFNTKVIGFAAIIVSYIFAFAILHTVQRNQVIEVRQVETGRRAGDIFDSDTDEKLLVLEEAGKFFGASLKTNDMFRLISSRVADIVSYSTCAFFLLNDTNKFTVPFAIGRNSRLLESIDAGCDQGIAGKSFLSRVVETDKELEVDRESIETDFLVGLNSAIAIPLFWGDEVFCVLVLYRGELNSFSDKEKILAEAVGERITPLLIGSFSFERSVSNALTDSITNLPNERAFYLVLENQVAEAQRFPENRSLTVLAVDIKNFAEINQNYGHSTGDQVLVHTAELIETKLRQMDLLCRTANDEFLIVLPTVTGSVTERIIERIETAFISKPFKVSDAENCAIELSIGSATFREDGETAEQLIQNAKLRKRQSKTNASDKIIFFPKQHVN